MDSQGAKPFFAGNLIKWMDSQMNYELDSQQNAYSFYKAIVITSKDVKNSINPMINRHLLSCYIICKAQKTL